MSNYTDCTSVTPECPVSATTYGYYPNLASGIIYSIVFGIAAILQVAFSIKGRTWTWMIGLFIGCALECTGYVGRILLYYNPWDQTAFSLQVITLLLAPSFMNASLDLTLKHLVIRFGPEYSLLKPALYTWVFICTDILSILIQAIGGVMSVSGDNTSEGTTVMLVGISIQTVQLVAFGIVSSYYAWNVYRHSRHSEPISFKLKYFIGCVVGAYIFILIRCIYRIPEMAEGWGSALQRNQTDFLVLDGMSCAMAAVLLTIAHPTFCFPEMGRGHRAKIGKDYGDEMS